MAIFNFKKKGKVVDLTERYRKQQERTENIRRDMQQNNSQLVSRRDSERRFSIFDGATPSPTSPLYSTENSSETSSSVEERKRKLTKRLLDMTNKLEELSNQIYHMQQRIEVLEKKAGVSGF
jgi:DNA repair ATPase RecN